MKHKHTAVIGLLLTALLCISCGGAPADTEPVTEAPSQTEEETVVMAEPLNPTEKLFDADTLANHEKIELWQNNNPFANEESNLRATLQAYLVDGAKSCVVIFPGGGYFQLSEESEGTAIAKAYNEEGISAFVACYRYKPYTFDTILADGQRAVQFVRYYAEEFGIAPDKIALCGFSAGGHLAVTVAEYPCTENLVGDEMGAVDSTPNALVLGYPVTNLHDSVFDLMDGIFVGDEAAVESGREQYTYTHAPELCPPTFAFYSVRDSLVDYTVNAIPYCDKLTELGIKNTCRAYSDGEHGIGLGKNYKDYSQWLHESADFLREIGW